MINYNLIKTNRINALATVLILSLFVNFYLIHKQGINENRIELINRNGYSSFFSTLMYYGNSLDYLVSNEIEQEKPMSKDYSRIINEISN